LRVLWALAQVPAQEAMGIAPPTTTSTSGMLLMWDRGLHSYAMVQATVSKRCDYLGRLPANFKLLHEKPLEDGSYLSWIYPSGKFRKKVYRNPRVVKKPVSKFRKGKSQTQRYWDNNEASCFPCSKYCIALSEPY